MEMVTFVGFGDSKERALFDVREKVRRFVEESEREVHITIHHNAHVEKGKEGYIVYMPIEYNMV